MGSGRNRLYECISLDESMRHVVADANNVNTCVKLFLEAGLPFQWVTIVDGGFDACYDVIQDQRALCELVDFDADRCRPARYYRYKKLQETRPKAALVLKTHALNAIRERSGGAVSSSDGSDRGASSSSSSSSSGRSWGSMFNAAIAGAKRRSSKTFEQQAGGGGGSGSNGSNGGSGKDVQSARRRRSWSGGSDDGSKRQAGDGNDDEVESAIIAAMEAVQMTNSAASSSSSSSSSSFKSSSSSAWFKSVGSRINRAVTSLKVPSTGAASQADKKLRRNSSPAASRRNSSGSLESPLASPALPARPGRVDVDDDDDTVDTPAWDQFTLTPKVPALVVKGGGGGGGGGGSGRGTHAARSVDQLLQDEIDSGRAEDASSRLDATKSDMDALGGFPVEITRNEAVASIFDVRPGDSFVETDFITSCSSDGPSAQWFQCEYVLPNALAEEELAQSRRNGWDHEEFLILTSVHLLVVRSWRNNPLKTDRERYMEKAREVKMQASKQAKAAAQRFGRWMSSLKSPSGTASELNSDVSAGMEGGGDKSSSSSSSVSLPSLSDHRGISREIKPSSPSSPKVTDFVRSEEKKDAPVLLPTVISVEVTYLIKDIQKMTKKKKDPNVLSLYFGDEVPVLCVFEDPASCANALRKKVLDLRTGEQQPPDFAASLTQTKSLLVAGVVDTPALSSPQADSAAFSFGGDSDSEEEEEAEILDDVSGWE